jgi:dipeptidyl aminopeptidase/acylaminoacyl peptidase
VRGKLGWVTLAALVLGLLGVWLIGSALSRSTPASVADAKLPARDVWIKTADGLDIAGTYRPGNSLSAPGILLLHGNGASRAATDADAAWLAEQGFATLTIDFRGHGESDAADHSFGLFEARDAKVAFEWLRKYQGGARIGVIGISLGGAAALLGDEGPLPADAMVLQAVYPDIRSAIRNRLAERLGGALAALGEPLLSYQSWLRQGVGPERMAPMSAMSKVKAPVLMIGGAEDVYTPETETRALFEAAGGAKELWIVPGLGHAGMSDAATQEYRSRVGAFFARGLLAN